ncbi:hypothetical protein [Pseudoroseomonas cervicalis]|uniref:hypothetical protein n=1 Tax=Teichococcus cervicalis TaxID=204525 RepID=UPI0022F14854|nr:hypothetical protein [Pseudoroseomonas cervicalis]WBV44398.1 hypothetical protein PFY06_07510 [Pseudoroseomonas cervicalis]
MRLLVAAVLLLPALILAALAWQAWQQSWREAETEVSRSAEAAAEYALRLLEGHTLRAQRANDMLRGLSDATIRAEQTLLSAQLSTLVAEAGGEAVLNIFVFDAAGHPLVSATVPSVPFGQSFADRPFNQLLRARDAPATAVSGPYRGRIDGSDFFAVTLRREGTGNDRPEGSYQGIINISARTQETAGRLRRLLKNPADSLALLLPGGTVLAATGAGAAQGVPALPPALREAAPSLALPRRIRDADGLAVLQPVPGWSVQAYAARPREQVVARWRASVGRLLLLGGPATLALLGLALMVRRGQRRLIEANAGLERRVAERTAALAASEERLRLAQEAAGIGVWELTLGPWGARRHRPGTAPSGPTSSSGCSACPRRGAAGAARAAAPGAAGRPGAGAGRAAQRRAAAGAAAAAVPLRRRCAALAVPHRPARGGRGRAAGAAGRRCHRHHRAAGKRRGAARGRGALPRPVRCGALRRVPVRPGDACHPRRQ